MIVKFATTKQISADFGCKVFTTPSFFTESRMVQGPSTKSSPDTITEYFLETCAEANLKVTHQRLHIYRELIKVDDHPTAETLYSRLRTTMPTLSLDTVYRTLGTLEQHGLIKRVQTVNAQARYEARMNVHHHFICCNCEKVIDFDWPSFDGGDLPGELEQIGTVSERTVTMSGTCSDCIHKE